MDHALGLLALLRGKYPTAVIEPEESLVSVSVGQGS